MDVNTDKGRLLIGAESWTKYLEEQFQAFDAVALQQKPEGDLVWIKHWAIGYSNSTAAQREEAGAVANAALTKLRSLKR